MLTEARRSYALYRSSHGGDTLCRLKLTDGSGRIFGVVEQRVDQGQRTRIQGWAEAACVRVTDASGTRLGQVLQVFLTREHTRYLARGAVVVVVSDGWERGDGAELAEQLSRLHRMSHLLVWANPHRGKEGYRPVQVGIVAALPHVDKFVAGHSLRAFEDLLEVIAHA